MSRSAQPSPLAQRVADPAPSDEHSLWDRVREPVSTGISLTKVRIEDAPRPGRRRRPPASRMHVWGVDLGSSRVAVDGLLLLAIVLMLLAAVVAAIGLTSFVR